MGNRGKKYSTETTGQQLEEAVDSKEKINTKETFFNMLFPPIILIEDLEECSSMGKKLVLCKNSSKLATSRKVKAFLKAREILTKDPEILEIVKGFKIPFLKNPTQERVPQTSHMGHEQADLIHVKIENMLKKGAIQQTEPSSWGVFKQYFLCWEKR